MCTEYAKNGLQVGLHRVCHVLDSLSSWTPCTRARSHHCRMAALPQAIAEQAVATSRCARARWHFTATSPPLEGRHRQAAVSSTPVSPAAVAKPSRATSRPSKTTSECGRTPWCSSSTSPPPLSLHRPSVANSHASPAVFCDQGPWAQIRQSKGA